MLRRTPNVAIVGSSSLLGKELRQVIEDSHFPVGKLTLLETEEYAGLLHEFAGEIQITQVIAPSAFDDTDIGFFACSREIMRSYLASGARFPNLTIDMTQTAHEGIVFIDGVSDSQLLKTQGYFLSPHPAAIVIARVLSQLNRAFGLQSSAVTVLEPASERGSAGLDELQDQTVNLLNFQQIDSKIFSGQLAFNILPEAAASEEIENLVLQQVLTVLGVDFALPTITVVQAPVFHSHAFSMFVALANSPATEDIVAQLRQDQARVLPEENFRGGPSPVGVVGTDKIHVGRIRQSPHHPNVYALWLVADNLRIAASNAVQLAENILLAPAQR